MWYSLTAYVYGRKPLMVTFLLYAQILYYNEPYMGIYKRLNPKLTIH